VRTPPPAPIQTVPTTPVPLPVQPSATPTPTPVPNSRTSVTVPAPTATPLPLPIAGTVPSGTPALETAPVASAVPLSTPLPSVIAIELRPGVNEFFHLGPSQPLLTLLAPLAGKYSSVSFKAPNGFWVNYLPGSPGGQNLVVTSGAQISIIMTDSGTILLPLR